MSVCEAVNAEQLSEYGFQNEDCWWRNQNEDHTKNGRHSIPQMDSLEVVQFTIKQWDGGFICLIQSSECGRNENMIADLSTLEITHD